MNKLFENLLVLTFLISHTLLAAQNYNMPFRASDTIYTGSGTIFDNGADLSYANNSSDTLVIYPDSAGKKIVLDFRVFSVEGCCDRLSVYNGDRIGEQLISNYTTNPGSIGSSDSTGALTLWFRSDYSVTYEGFEAEIYTIDSLPPTDLAITQTDTTTISVIAGSSFYSHSSLNNPGPYALTGISLQYFLSEDTLHDEQDVLLNTHSLSSLAPNIGYQVNMVLAVANDLTEGEYYILTKVFSDSEIADPDPGNNLIFQRLSVTPIEQDLSFVWVNLMQESLSWNSNLQLEYRLYNTGNAPVVNAYTGFYISEDLALDENDIEISKDYVSNISHGGSRNFYHAISGSQLSGKRSGLYYLIIQADCDSTLNETRENNNLFITQILFTEPDTINTNLAAKALNLTVDSIANENLIGLKLSFDSETNLPPIDFGIYISADTILNLEEDLKVYELSNYTFQKGNHYLSRNFVIELPDSVNSIYGDQYFLIQLDENHVIPERNEADNIIHAPLFIDSVPHTDLCLDNLYISHDSILKHQNLSLSCDLFNNGTARAYNATIEFYLSTDSIRDESDTLLKSLTFNTLTPSQIKNVYYSYGNMDLSVGKYYIIIETATEHDIPEKNLKNNLRVLPFRVIYEESIQGLDVILSSVDCPDSLLVGNTCNANLNYSLLSKSSQEVGFRGYLSTDSIFDTGDLSRPLFTLSHNTGALSYQNMRCDFTINDTIESGDYFFIFKADYQNQLFEEDENNNLIIKPITLSKPSKRADLVIKEVDLTKSILYPHESVSGNMICFNRSGTIDSVLLSVYLKNTNNPQFETEPIISYRLLGIGEQLKAFNFEFELPDTLTPGIYSLRFVLIPLSGENKAGSVLYTEYLNLAIQLPDIDLKFNFLSITDSVIYPNSYFQGSFEIVNLGTTPPQNDPLVRIYLSEDNQLSEDDIVITSATMSYQGIREPINQNYDVFLPEIITAGDYYLLSIIDANEAIQESNETNNITGVPVSIAELSFNLMVESMILNANEIHAGSDISISCRVKNIGTNRTSSSYLAYYVSVDSLLDEGDIRIGTDYISPLSPNSSEQEYFNYYPGSGINTGNYYIICEADYSDLIAESDETDNTAFMAFKLIPREIDPEIIAANNGDTLLLVSDMNQKTNLSIRNNGASTLSRPMSISIYLSTDDSLNLLEDTYMGNLYINNYIGSGGIISQEISINCPATIPKGNYHTFFLLDPADDLIELDENNNVFSIPTRIIDPDVDLIISEITLSPDTLMQGETNQIEISISNTGTTIAQWNCQVYVYLSTDTIQDNDDELIFVYSIPEIPASTTNSAIKYFQLNESHPSGSYYMTCQVDPYNSIEETKEDNNYGWTPIYLKPPDIDLEISNVGIFPNQLAIEDSLNLSYEIHNEGTIRSEAASVGYYLSTDAVFESSDLFLGTTYITALSASEIRQINHSIVIPELETGTYYVLLVADYLNAVAETDEENNLCAVRITLIDRHSIDYSISVREFTSRFDSLDISYTVTNKGYASAGLTCEFKLLYSVDSLVDSNDQVISVYPLSPISAGDSVVISYAGARPETTYNFIIAWADSWNHITESNEHNNIISARVPKLWSDLALSVPFAIEEVEVGEMIRVTTHIENLGESDSEPTTIDYYLSTDEYQDDSDLLLHSGVIEPVMRQEAINYQQDMQIPWSTVPGSYTLIMLLNEADNPYPLASGNNIARTYLRINSLTNGTEQIIEDNGEITLYPNPVHDNLWLKTNGDHYTYMVFNSLGESIMAGELFGTLTEISTASLLPAIYYIRITGDNSQQTLIFELTGPD